MQEEGEGNVMFPFDALDTAWQHKLEGGVELTFRHRASSIWDRGFATLQRTLFIYLINKYISFSDICLIVHH